VTNALRDYTDVEPGDTTDEQQHAASSSTDTVLTSVAMSTISAASSHRLSMPVLTFDTHEFTVSDDEEQLQQMAADYADQDEAQGEDPQPQENSSFKNSDQSSSVHMDQSDETLDVMLRNEESTSEVIQSVAIHGDGQQCPEQEATQDPVSSDMSDLTSFSDLLKVRDVDPAMLKKLSQPLILLSPVQTPPPLRNSEQEKDRSDVSVQKKLDMRKDVFGMMVQKKKTIPTSTPKSIAENAEAKMKVVSESSQKPAPNKESNRDPDLVPGGIVNGGELSKKENPKRTSTDDKTSRSAQLENRSSPKRPRVVHPPASVKLTLSKSSKTENPRIPCKPNKENNRGPGLEPGEIVNGGERSKKENPKRASTDDKTFRSAQPENRNSPKRPKIVHPPASVKPASSKSSKTENPHKPNKESNRDHDLEPGEIIDEDELSKKGTPKRASTNDEKSRCAQPAHRSSPKRPKVVRPPASVELASSKSSETGDYRIPYRPIQNSADLSSRHPGHRPVMSYGEAPRRDCSDDRRHDSYSRYEGARSYEYHRHQTEYRSHSDGGRRERSNESEEQLCWFQKMQRGWRY